MVLNQTSAVKKQKRVEADLQALLHPKLWLDLGCSSLPGIYKQFWEGKLTVSQHLATVLATGYVGCEQCN